MWSDYEDRKSEKNEEKLKKSKEQYQKLNDWKNKKVRKLNG